MLRALGRAQVAAYSRQIDCCNTEQKRDVPANRRSQDQSPVEDAVRLRLSDHPVKRRASRHTEASDRCVCHRPVDTKPPLFEPGKDVSGTYGAGRFVTDSGIHGTYHALPGGQIKFQAGSVVGYLMPGNKAIAYDKSTDEAYTMQIDYRDGAFKISNVEPVAADGFRPGDQRPIVSEENSKHIKFRHGGTGPFSFRYFSEQQDARLAGEGFLMPNGIYFAALESGGAVMGHYSLDDSGSLAIYDRTAWK
ncbi:MAG: hypothetical protein KDD44_08150 [Bdellovibrionales bacterium]|nr:hypothetical protein [Bdellovibrionales bacterium]